MLTLYFSPGASSMAPHIALHEVGVPFDTVPLSLRKHENRAPAYLALNPEGKVPTLVIDGRPLTEVAAILYFLARRYPEAGLMPSGDPEAEAHVVSWISFIAATIHPARRQGVQRWHEVFGIAEQRLGPREWAHDRFSIADIHLFRLFWRYFHATHPAPGTFPNLEAHYRRMMARPAVQQTCNVEAAIGYDLPV
jgi:glutathione S-transferase